jgi:predicted aminopeptidase
VIGCASYRGYFSPQAAERYAAGLREQGLDVTVEEVAAYSTLGWFSDPLPSTLITWPEARLAGLIFHELAHQKLYVPGDSSFNESFATLVEQVGVERWLNSRGARGKLEAWRIRQEREAAFIRLLFQTRGRLDQLYGSSIPPAEMRRRKAETFEGLRREYSDLRGEWNGYRGFDHWFKKELNNARLASIATYEEWVPALRALLRQQGGDLEAFYRECERLADLPPDRRRAGLDQTSRRNAR